jgi:signal transduction histidine kinase
VSLWQRLVGDRPIVTRLVLRVAVAMTVVLLAAAAFVYWRVEFALNRQLDQDLAAYQQVVRRAVSHAARPPGDTPGESYQVYDGQGAVVSGNADRRLVDRPTVSAARAGGEQSVDVGSLLPPSPAPYRVVAQRVSTPAGPVVVAAAISRRKHDEALRELLLQLTIADLLALVAASFVGYRTARAALDPVERYRGAAASGDVGRRLPVSSGREDELTRLGHTFNDLLARIEAAGVRERQFLADASHELRSPLSLMRTEIEYVLHRPRTPEEMRAALTSLGDQVERLVGLANALLDLEELRSDSALLRDDVALPDLVGGVVGRYQRQAAREGRRLVVQADDAVVRVNRRWMDLALDNLVSNAFRHGQGTVRVDARLCEERLLLAVADEGPGFPAEFVAVAFDRFTRAEESRSGDGSGLGLSLVQAVTEKHGGRAGVDRAAVTIDVPVRPSAAGSR